MNINYYHLDQCPQCPIPEKSCSRPNWFNSLDTNFSLFSVSYSIISQAINHVLDLVPLIGWDSIQTGENISTNEISINEYHMIYNTAYN